MLGLEEKASGRGGRGRGGGHKGRGGTSTRTRGLAGGGGGKPLEALFYLPAQEPYEKKDSSNTYLYYSKKGHLTPPRDPSFSGK